MKVTVLGCEGHMGVVQCSVHGSGRWKWKSGYYTDDHIEPDPTEKSKDIREILSKAFHILLEETPRTQEHTRGVSGALVEVATWDRVVNGHGELVQGHDVL